MRQIGKLAKRRYWQLAVGAIGSGTASAIIEYILTGATTAWLPLVIMVAILLLLLAVFWVLHEPEQKNQPEIVQSPPLPTSQPEIVQPPPLPAHLAQGRIFSPRSPDELVNEVKGLTDIRRQHAIQLHLGQWLHVEGRIRNVGQMAPDDEITVSVDLTKSGVTVFMDFAPSYWQARLQAANIGDTISAIGKIENVQSYGGDGFVSLDECELVALNGNSLTS